MRNGELVILIMQIYEQILTANEQLHIPKFDYFPKDNYSHIKLLLSHSLCLEDKLYVSADFGAHFLTNYCRSTTTGNISNLYIFWKDMI